MEKRIDIINGQEVVVKVYAPKPLPKKLTAGKQPKRSVMIKAAKIQRAADDKRKRQMIKAEDDHSRDVADTHKRLDYLFNEKADLMIRLDEVKRKIRSTQNHLAILEPGTQMKLFPVTVTGITKAG